MTHSREPLHPRLAQPINGVLAIPNGPHFKKNKLFQRMTIWRWASKRASVHQDVKPERVAPWFSGHLCERLRHPVSAVQSSAVQFVPCRAMLCPSRLPPAAERMPAGGLTQEHVCAHSSAMVLLCCSLAVPLTHRRSVAGRVETLRPFSDTVAERRLSRLPSKLADSGAPACSAASSVGSGAREGRPWA